MRRTALLLVLAASLVGCKAKTPIIEPTVSPSESVSPSPTPVRMPTPKAKKAVVVDEGIIKLYQVETDTISELATGQGVR
ncbi:MAG: hypothetical protein ACLGH3_08285, partial [Actinomycetota bacterium]